MTISALPTAPQPSDDRATFNTKAFALLAALSTFVTEANATGSQASADAAAALASKLAALVAQASAEAARDAAIANAAAAAASAGASQWVSGNYYALGARVWSPLNDFTYRRTVAGAGTTDPSLDPANWSRVQPVPTVTATSYFF